jgi:hypothetical protein
MTHFHEFEPITELLLFKERDIFYLAVSKYLDIDDILSLDEAIVNSNERNSYLDIMTEFPTCSQSFYEPICESIFLSLNSWLIDRNMIDIGMFTSEFIRLSCWSIFE